MVPSVRVRSLFLVLAGPLALASCRAEKPEPSAKERAVLASFYPLAWFAQRIAGEAVDVGCPVPPEADPAVWRPSRDDVLALQGATLVLVNGASFERWLDEVSLPEGRVVDTSRGFADRFLKHRAVTHSHGPGGEHTHEGIDGHTWLDPHNAKLQAQAVHDALARAFPEHAATCAKGLAALHADLDGLDAALQALGPRLAGTKLVASHPAWGYLAARYGWTLVGVDLDPARAPTADEQDRLRGARGDAQAIVLWESEPDPRARDAVAALGIANVVFSPCETLAPAAVAAGEDYLTVMRANVARLEAALPE